jgi:hypothetical protein
MSEREPFETETLDIELAIENAGLHPMDIWCDPEEWSDVEPEPCEVGAV